MIDLQRNSMIAETSERFLLISLVILQTIRATAGREVCKISRLAREMN